MRHILAIIGTPLAISTAQAAPPGLSDIPVPADNPQAYELVAYLTWQTDFINNTLHFFPNGGDF